MIKKLWLFICFCLCITSVYAKDVNYPVDTIALEEALKEIHDATMQADIYLYVMTKQTSGISAQELAEECVAIVRDNVSCMNFLKTYNSYLDHANFCIRANNFGSQNLTYKQCGAYVNAAQGYSQEDTNSNEWGNCKRWYDVAEKCLNYLQNYYKQKLSTSKSDKKYYECLLDKIQTGNIDFPMSNMEKECKQ